MSAHAGRRPALTASGGVAPLATGLATAPAADRPARLLASLLVFGRQTDREPEVVLQGFAPDVDTAAPIVAALLGCEFGAEADAAGMPGTTPTNCAPSTLLETARMPMPMRVR